MHATDMSGGIEVTLQDRWGGAEAGRSRWRSGCAPVEKLERRTGIGSEASPATLTSDEGQMESKGEFPPHVHVASHDLGLLYTRDP